MITFKNYTRVIVVNGELKSYGKHGVVMGTDHAVEVNGYFMKERVSVRLDDGQILGFNPSSLDYEERRKENKMITGFDRVVFVQFGAGGKEYAYADYRDAIVNEGDHVVVNVRGKFEVVTVTRVQPFVQYTGPKITAEIIDVVHTENWEKRKKARERKKYLTEQLEREATKYSRMNVYEQMAKDNPVIADMVEELKSL